MYIEPFAYLYVWSMISISLYVLSSPSFGVPVLDWLEFLVIKFRLLFSLVVFALLFWLSLLSLWSDWFCSSILELFELIPIFSMDFVFCILRTIKWEANIESNFFSFSGFVLWLMWLSKVYKNSDASHWIWRAIWDHPNDLAKITVDNFSLFLSIWLKRSFIRFK